MSLSEDLKPKGVYAMHGLNEPFADSAHGATLEVSEGGMNAVAVAFDAIIEFGFFKDAVGTALVRTTSVPIPPALALLVSGRWD